jgi:glycosyltransferase involved in cell wall biosynthesis
LIEESLEAGVQCFAFCKTGSAFSEWCTEKGVPFKESSFKNSFDVISAFALKKWIRSNNIDLIHIHSGKGHGLYAISTLIGVRSLAILSRRVDFPIKSNVWAKWKYNLNSIVRIISVSDAIKRMTEIGIRDRSKVVTIHSGIDLTRFKGNEVADLRNEYGISQGKTLIGNVAALAPHKDYGTFLRTARACIDKEKSVHFLIIGEGDERGFIEQEIIRLKLVDHVTMTGFRNDIPAVLRALDIFLITSETEGLGTSVLDAFAAGTPVIATAAGGIPESVIHQKTGLLCPVQDHECLSKSIDRLMSDDDLRKRLTSEATSHLQQFTKQETARRTLAIYQEVLDK